MKNQAKYNLERLCWVAFSWAIIFMGIFIKGAEILIPLGAFVIGNVLGGLNEK